MRKNANMKAQERLKSWRQHQRDREVKAIRIEEAIEQTRKDLQLVQPLVQLAHKNNNLQLPRFTKSQELLFGCLLNADPKTNLSSIISTHIMLILSGAFTRQELNTKISTTRLASSFLVKRQATSSESFELTSHKTPLWQDVENANLELQSVIREFETKIHTNYKDPAFALSLQIEIGIRTATSVSLLARALLFTSLGPLGWALLATDLVLNLAHLYSLSEDLEEHQRSGESSRVKGLSECFGELGKGLEIFETVYSWSRLGIKLSGSREFRGFFGRGLFKKNMRKLSAFHTVMNRAGVARKYFNPRLVRAYGLGSSTLNHIKLIRYTYQAILKNLYYWAIESEKLDVKDFSLGLLNIYLDRNRILSRVRSISGVQK